MQAPARRFAVLIIDSDEDPVYAEARAIWRRNAQLQGVPIFFLRASPDIHDDVLYVDGDTLYTRWFDDFAERLNDKMLKAFQYLQQLGGYDFVLRSNLSSFYRLDLLAQVLQQLPVSRIYAGCPNEIELPIVGGGVLPLTYISGSGFILSADMVDLVLQRKHQFARNIIDDIWIALTLQDIPRLALARCEVEDFHEISLENVLKVQARIEQAVQRQVFHFRVKNTGALPRKQLDLPVFAMLIQRFMAPRTDLL